MTDIKQQIADLYQDGLEKYAGDETLAKSYVEGFFKEALNYGNILKGVEDGLGKGIGAGLVGVGLGLGIHGISSALSGVNNAAQKSRFNAAYDHVLATNPIVQNADPAKVRSYAETIFKFAPQVAGDPNLLSSVLAGSVHGEGVDTMTIRSLADLEARVVETKKAKNFSPKTYL